MEKFLQIPMQVEEGKDYPIGKLYDPEIEKEVKVNFMHYKSATEAFAKWERRKRRINQKDCWYIFLQTPNMEKQDMEFYDKLDIPNKILVLDNSMKDKIKLEKTEVIFSNGFHMDDNEFSWDFPAIEKSINLFKRYEKGDM